MSFRIPDWIAKKGKYMSEADAVKEGDKPAERDWIGRRRIFVYRQVCVGTTSTSCRLCSEQSERLCNVRLFLFTARRIVS